jgi:N-acetylneuraminic acid mutarotase
MLNFSKHRVIKQIVATETASPKRCAHSGFVTNNKLYIVGGFHDAIVTGTVDNYTTISENNVFHYDLIGNYWFNDAVPLIVLHQHAGCKFKEKLYVHGGLEPTEHLYRDKTYGMSLKSMKFELIQKKNDTPPTRFKHSFDVVGNVGILFGGCNHRIGCIYNDTWKYIFETNEWVELYPRGKIPSERFGHATAPVGNSLYVFGGKDLYSTSRFNDLFCLTLEEPTFHNVITHGDIPVPVAGAKMIEYCGNLYLFGGFDGVKDLDKLYQFDIMRSCWNLIESHGITGRSFHSMSIWNDGIVSNLVIFGGIWENIEEKSKCHWNDIWIVPFESRRQQDFLLGALIHNNLTDVLFYH